MTAEEKFTEDGKLVDWVSGPNSEQRRLVRGCVWKGRGWGGIARRIVWSPESLWNMRHQIIHKARVKTEVTKSVFKN